MRFSVLIVLIALPPIAAAQMYKWVDAKGHVHYTQTPPPQGSFQPVAPAAPPAAPGTAPNLGVYGKKLQGEREQREQLQANAERETQQRKQNCSKARARQAWLDRYNGHIGTTTEDGGREAWTPERYAAEHSQVESVITRDCN